MTNSQVQQSPAMGDNDPLMHQNETNGHRGSIQVNPAENPEEEKIPAEIDEIHQPNQAKNRNETGLSHS